MRIRSRISTVGVMVLCLALAAFPAFATADSSGVTVVKGQLDLAKTDATSIVEYGIPVVLGLAVLFVALKYGKRLIAKL